MLFEVRWKAAFCICFLMAFFLFFKKKFVIVGEVS